MELLAFLHLTCVLCRRHLNLCVSVWCWDAQAAINVSGAAAIVAIAYIVRLCEWMILFYSSLTWIKWIAYTLYAPHTDHILCARIRLRFHTYFRLALLVKCYEHVSCTSHALFCPFSVVFSSPVSYITALNIWIKCVSLCCGCHRHYLVCACVFISSALLYLKRLNG